MSRKRQKKSGKIIGIVLAVALAFAFYLIQNPGTFDFTADDSPQNSSVYEWDEEAAPEYYLVTGEAKVEDAPAEGEVVESPLDSEGRATTVKTTVNYENVEESRGWRESYSDTDPTAWGDNEIVEIELPDGKEYHGYFKNRSHLVADSLGGHFTRENVITGTRTQNVGANDGEGGMAYCETKVREFIYDNPDETVYYSATANYKGDELMARSVTVDMKSSDGSIDEEVIVYNAAKGFEIDYSTGDYHKVD